MTTTLMESNGDRMLALSGSGLRLRSVRDLSDDALGAKLASLASIENS